MPEVRVSSDGPVATITLARPGKRNSLTDSMYNEVAEAARSLARDPLILALVLTGDGDHFCAGSDISSLPDPDHTQFPTAAASALADFPGPVIAAVRGHCFGGGLALACACDIRLANEDADFCAPPAKLGIVFPQDATQRLVSLVGPARSKYLLFTAARISARRAYEYGLVDDVIDGSVGDAASQLAHDSARLSQLSTNASKAIINSLAEGSDVSTAMENWRHCAVVGPDFVEGVSAFRDKRPPQFQWRRPVT